MIFHRIILENIFSYQGVQTLEFIPPDDQSGPLQLVIGRNGFGKTSFLNAVTLLFAGSEYCAKRQRMRRNSYVLGDEINWSGILNREAKRDGAATCSVEVQIGSSKAVEFVARRRWNMQNGEFSAEDETLEVEVDGRSLAGDSAESRLNEFLPRELVPFFFFDGEEIRYLAESSDLDRARAMEQLLSLSFINGVEEELATLTKEWRRATLPADIQAEIASEEAKLTATETRIEALRERVEDFESQKRDLDEEAEKLQHHMEILRQSGGLANTEGLDREIADLEEALQRQQNDIAHELAVDAPLIANPSLIQSSLGPLQAVVDTRTKASESVLETLFNVLPERLFKEAPQPHSRLSEEQRGFYVKKLKKILDSYAVQDDVGSGILESLDLVRARNLLEQFRGVNASIKTLRNDRARRLREVSRMKLQLADKRAERREAQYGSSDAIDAYRQLETEFADLQQEIGKLDADAIRAHEQIEELSTDRENLARSIRELERKEYDATKSDKRLKIALGLRDSFKDYRRTRRDAKRQQIKIALNKHFCRLMSGHRLINEIDINEDFYLSFIDANGDKIGHSTISHGMRQLAVTALLWALKDVSGKFLPIIVDTPLARIDRENQENLLGHYYPNASDQVIVLATDSEIDQRKYELIRPDLGRVYTLSNPDGQSTSANEIKRTRKQAPSWRAVENG
jgi:DNA sulfur modification protein DndD